jgi:hypothetical protein
MEWGTAPAWAAVAASTAAVIISFLAWRQAKRSADASTSSAKTAAEALEFQRQKEIPKVYLRIDRAPGKGVYRLKNHGGAAALNLVIVAEDDDQVQWLNPLNGTLDPNDFRDFVPASGANPPSSLRFTWQGQQEPKHLSMP